MQAEIKAKLDILEQENGVTILYACESGSRAWGFPSKDSDYDVRFIYAHPIDWYLSIVEKRDVIDLPVLLLPVCFVPFFKCVIRRVKLGCLERH